MLDIYLAKKPFEMTTFSVKARSFFGSVLTVGGTRPSLDVAKIRKPKSYVVKKYLFLSSLSSMRKNRTPLIVCHRQ